MDQAFPSDLTHEQWKLIEQLLPRSRPGGRPRTTNLRRVVNAIFYLNRTGCQWRYLPTEFPPWQTVYDYFSKWLKRGLWHDIQLILSAYVRHKEGRTQLPSLAIVDSQSVRAHFGEARAKDYFKKVTGRKRSILVDSLGFLICCFVHKANDQDFRGLMTLLHRLPPAHAKSLQKILGDQAYRFATLKEEAGSHGIEIETLDRKKLGTNMKPKRWIVERSIAWFNHYRRLSRDYEKSCAQSEAMIFISQIQLLLRRAFYFWFSQLSAPPETLFRHPPAARRCVKLL